MLSIYLSSYKSYLYLFTVFFFYDPVNVIYLSIINLYIYQSIHLFTMNIFTYSDSYFINPFFLSIYIYRFFFYDGVVTVLDEQVYRIRVKFIDNTLKIKKIITYFNFYNSQFFSIQI